MRYGDGWDEVWRWVEGTENIKGEREGDEMNKSVPYEEAKNNKWNLWVDSNNKYTADQALLAVMMDIRGELQKINRTLSCRNTLDIPHLLRQIQRNTRRKKKVIKKGGK